MRIRFRKARGAVASNRDADTNQSLQAGRIQVRFGPLFLFTHTNRPRRHNHAENADRGGLPEARERRWPNSATRPTKSSQATTRPTSTGSSTPLATPPWARPAPRQSTSASFSRRASSPNGRASFSAPRRSASADGSTTSPRASASTGSRPSAFGSVPPPAHSTI